MSDSSQTALKPIAPRPLTPRPLKIKSNRADLLPGEKEITRKQLLFVDYYQETGNAYQSAKRAGYSESTCLVASTSILQSPAVVRELRRRAEELFKEKKVDKDWVLQGLTTVADANILNYGEIQEDGSFKPNLKLINRDMGAAIQEISYDINGRMKIRLYDKLKAKELISRIQKAIPEGSGGEESGEIPSIQTLDRLVQKVTNVQINVISGHEFPSLPG